MSVRTFVSFRWAAPATEESAQAARRLAENLSSWLTGKGFKVDPCVDRDDHLQEVWVRQPDVWIEILVGYVGDGDREWLITCYPRAPGLWKLLVGSKAGWLANAAACMRALDQGLRSDATITEVRWYQREDFEANKVDTWNEAPV